MTIEGYHVDNRLLERARKSEDAISVDGKDEDGTPVLMIVMTGVNVGLFKQRCRDLFPGFYEIYQRKSKE